MPSAPLPGRPCNYCDDQRAFNYRGAYLKGVQLLVTNRIFLERNRITTQPVTRPTWDGNRAPPPSPCIPCVYCF